MEGGRPRVGDARLCTGPAFAAIGIAHIAVDRHPEGT